MSNQGIQFERPIGAPADVKELEYIAALHQTNEEEIRTNGMVHGTYNMQVLEVMEALAVYRPPFDSACPLTPSSSSSSSSCAAKDIRNYLTSRHGIYVEADTISDRIIAQLCGTWKSDEDDDATKPKFKKKKDADSVMDICQMTCLLMIPYLRQEDIEEANRPKNSLVRGMAEQVLKLILEELEGQGVDLKQFKGVDENFETGTRITSKLIQHMFDAYGEHSVPEDILDEMVEQAAAPTVGKDDDPFQSSQPRLKTRQKKRDDQVQVFWNKTSFQRALTADVQLYKPDWEAEQTTHYQDARSAQLTKGRSQGDRIKLEDDFYTAPTVDQGADQYRSVIWTLLLWVSFLFFYGCYMFDPAFDVNFDSCKHFEWGCDAGSAIVNWIIVFVQLGIVGSLYICLGSLGNSSYPAELGSDKAVRVLGVFLAIGVVACATIVPNFVEGKAFIWNSNKADGYEAMYWICFSLGVILIGLQFIRIVDIFAPLGLGPLGAGGRTRSEQCTKQAATKKINTMVENAMLLHVAPILAGAKPRPGAGVRFPVKHASPTVVRLADQLHEELDEDNTTQTYRAGDAQTLLGGEGSGRALLNYKAMDDLTETTGGVLWAYQRMADGRIYDEEGIWFSARLITSTIVQLLVVVMLVVMYFVVLGEFKENKSNTVAVGSRRLMMEDILELEPPSLLQAGFLTSHEELIFENQQHRDHRRVHPAGRHQHRHLQFISPVNDTHYTDGTGIYPNIIYDVNRTHFTDGTSFWTYNVFSHNGTHVL